MYAVACSTATSAATVIGQKSARRDTRVCVFEQMNGGDLPLRRPRPRVPVR